MKITLDISPRQWLRNLWKKHREENKKYSIGNLTSHEAVRYLHLRHRTPGMPVTFLIWPFYLAFYLGLFSLVMFFAFDINLKVNMLALLKFAFDIWIPSIFIMAIWLGILKWQASRQNRSIIKRIIEERKR